MARPAGSKNKVKEQIDEMISDIRDLPVDETEKQEAISELEDLLEAPVKEKKFMGYHPITGAEVWL